MENETSDSVNPESKAATPPSEAPRQPIVIPEVPPPVALKKETTYSHPDPTPLWKIILEIGAVAVGSLVAIIYIGQLCQMIKQNELTRNALLANQRPWLGNDGPATLTIDSVEADYASGRFTFTVKNFGPSPALSVGQGIQPFVRSAEGAKNNSYDFDKAREQACGAAYTNAFIAGTSIFPQQTFTYTHSGGFNVQGITPQNQLILIEGCIAYRDQFDPTKTTHYTSFCLFGGIKTPFIPSLCGVNERAD